MWKGSYLLRYIRSCDTHGHSNVRLLQGGRVVDTITSYGNNGSHALATFHNDQLLLGRGTGKHDLSVVSGKNMNVLVKIT